MIWVDLQSGLVCNDFESKLRSLGCVKSDSKNDLADCCVTGRRRPPPKNGGGTNGANGPAARTQSFEEEEALEAAKEQHLDQMTKRRLDHLFLPIWQCIQAFKGERKRGVEARREFFENDSVVLTAVLQSVRAPPIPRSSARGPAPRRPHTAPLGTTVPSRAGSSRAHKKTTRSSRPHTAPGKETSYALGRTGHGSTTPSTTRNPDISPRKHATIRRGFQVQQPSKEWRPKSPNSGSPVTKSYSPLSAKSSLLLKKRIDCDYCDTFLHSIGDVTESPEKRHIKMEDTKLHCYMDFEEVAVGEKDSKNVRRHFHKLACAGGEKRIITSTELAKQIKKIGLADAHVTRVLSFFKIPEKMRFANYMARVQLFFTKKITTKQQLCFYLLDADGDRVLSARDVFAVLDSIGTDAGCYAHQRGETWESPMAFKEVTFRPEDEIGIDLDIKAYPPEVVAVDQAKRGYREGIRLCDRLLSVNGVPVQENESLNFLTAQRTEALVLRLCTYQWTFRGDGFAVGAVSTGDFETLWHAYLSTRKRNVQALTVSDFQSIFGDAVPDFFNILREFFIGTHELEKRSHTRNAEEKTETPEKASVEPRAPHDVSVNFDYEEAGSPLAAPNALARSFCNFQTAGEQFIDHDDFIGKSAKLFGFPMPRLASHLFKLLAGSDPVITLENWVQTWTAWSYGTLALAFRIYDIDDDGVISIEDVEVIRCDCDEVEVSELKPSAFFGASNAPESQQKPARLDLWDELHWLYSFVWEITLEDESRAFRHDQIRGVPLGLFQQLHSKTPLLDQLEIGLGFRFCTLTFRQ